MSKRFVWSVTSLGEMLQFILIVFKLSVRMIDVHPCAEREKEEPMAIEEGKKAPAFSLPDENGNSVSLKDFSGKHLVLYFYPKDNTSG